MIQHSIGWGILKGMLNKKSLSKEKTQHTDHKHTDELSAMTKQELYLRAWMKV